MFVCVFINSIIIIYRGVSALNDALSLSIIAYTVNSKYAILFFWNSLNFLYHNEIK
jgi:hypothetical protein